MKLLMSVREFAGAVGVGESTAKLLVRDKAIESVTIGGRRLVPTDAVVEYVKNLRATARSIN